MKKTHIIGLILIAVAIGAIFTTVGSASTYETFAKAANNPNKEYHVVGYLEKAKPMEYNPEVNANLFTFYMKDNDSTEAKVFFNGTKPQDFEKSEQIVLVGRMGDEGFMASKILMKCPSKYNDGTPGEMKEFPAEA